MATAYYNECDHYAAQSLRNLIDAGHIAPGFVDERSIEDVHPRDLDGFTQCHFFAGIGVWSYALRLAGWPDDRPVWTGSCPCQPFSAAGKGVGFADERHLWPAFYHLIDKRRPAVVFGEQVASKDADPWIDLVCADMEALGYAFGAVPFPSAGVGAPHIRDRLYWVADADHAGLEGRCAVRQRAVKFVAGASSVVGRVANANGHGRPPGCERPPAVGYGAATEPDRGFSRLGAAERPGPTNGFWRSVDWISCRDGKSRPVEPGTFPLVDGAPARVGRLLVCGNALNAHAAAEFVRCFLGEA